MKPHALLQDGEVHDMPHDCTYKGDQSVEVWSDPPELQVECRMTGRFVSLPIIFITTQVSLVLTIFILL